MYSLLAMFVCFRQFSCEVFLLMFSCWMLSFSVSSLLWPASSSTLETHHVLIQPRVTDSLFVTCIDIRVQDAVKCILTSSQKERNSKQLGMYQSSLLIHAGCFIRCKGRGHLNLSLFLLIWSSNNHSLNEIFKLKQETNHKYSKIKNITHAQFHADFSLLVMFQLWLNVKIKP